MSYLPGLASLQILANEQVPQMSYVADNALLAKDDDVTISKHVLEKGTRPRQDHLVAATSWPSSEAKVTSVK